MNKIGALSRVVVASLVPGAREELRRRALADQARSEARALGVPEERAEEILATETADRNHTFDQAMECARHQFRNGPRPDSPAGVERIVAAAQRMYPAMCPEEVRRRIEATAYYLWGTRSEET